eukprot:7610864-Pyramimonas_sp.AAC.1
MTSVRGFLEGTDTMAAAQADEDRVKIDRAIAPMRQEFQRVLRPPHRQKHFLGRHRPPTRQNPGGSPL